MKYKEYKVINAGHLRSIEAMVNLNLKKGWIPLGNVYSAPKDKTVEPIWEIGPDNDSLQASDKEFETSTNWCQAMILPLEEIDTIALERFTQMSR